jgi:hypothetical protein
MGPKLLNDLAKLPGGSKKRIPAQCRRRRRAVVDYADDDAPELRAGLELADDLGGKGTGAQQEHALDPGPAESPSHSDHQEQDGEPKEEALNPERLTFPKLYSLGNGGEWEQSLEEGLAKGGHDGHVNGPAKRPSI